MPLAQKRRVAGSSRRSVEQLRHETCSLAENAQFSMHLRFFSALNFSVRNALYVQWHKMGLLYTTKKLGGAVGKIFRVFSLMIG